MFPFLLYSTLSASLPTLGPCFGHVFFVVMPRREQSRPYKVAVEEAREVRRPTDPTDRPAYSPPPLTTTTATHLAVTNEMKGIVDERPSAEMRAGENNE